MNSRTVAILAAGAVAFPACSRNRSVEFDEPPGRAIVIDTERAAPADAAPETAPGPWDALRTPDVTRQLYSEQASPSPAPGRTSPGDTDTTVSIRPPGASPGNPPNDNNE